MKDLVRLLIDQKADVLLIGGDFHEGCQYVPPVMAALAQVKTPLGTYAVLGNNDYEACYDDIVAVSGFLWRACAILSTWARTAHRPHSAFRPTIS